MGDRIELAIGCCRSSGDADATDLYPDPDSELLVDALGDLDIGAQMVSWDDPQVPWGSFDIVVVRSTWDSVDRPEEYLRWAWEVESRTRLVHPAWVLAWNLDTSYLAELAEAGLPVVPTQFVHPGDSWTPPTGEFVLKPAISAGGRETARYGPGHDDEATEHMERLLGTERAMMVQPHLPGVEDPGEVSLVFLGSGFSHAVRKDPVLEAGAAVLERPWKRMVFLGWTQPSSEEMTVALQVQAVLERRFGSLAYSRVDLVSAVNEQPLVIEVEVIDSYLSLAMEPSAAGRLATSLAALAGLVRDPSSR